ncbi:hypothetical protein Fmac_000279 [Flemingia macrophylla]|uniref:Uncharacterized protein n=1 Tax=Flemingia macrophylla TaxID=520843 RepID=A0ABD1NDT7_9FABA
MAQHGSGSDVEMVVDKSSSNVTSGNKNKNNNNRESITSSLSSILTKFHAGYFRISLSLGGQALLWKTLHDADSDRNRSTLRHVVCTLPSPAFLALWYLSLSVLLLLSLLYLLRCMFFFKMVKAEFTHPVGVNYLFAPWISWLLLLQSAPSVAPKTATYLVLWWVFAAPVVALDVKIYGQWFTKGKRFLSAVANPTSQMSVIGNLVGARAAARMGWKESAVGLFSLGMVHYFVLFVTLYQRLSGENRLPVLLRPVFFLFFAAPSVASLAWESIVGSFDTASKMLFFLSLFLFASLICRPALFKRSMRRFNVAWWAYSFPITILALVSADYAQEVKGTLSDILMLLLLALSVLVSLALTFFTFLNSKMLLPDNDPIASLLISLPSVRLSTPSRTSLWSLLASPSNPRSAPCNVILKSFISAMQNLRSRATFTILSTLEITDHLDVNTMTVFHLVSNKMKRLNLENKGKCKSTRPRVTDVDGMNTTTTNRRCSSDQGGLTLFAHGADEDEVILGVGVAAECDDTTVEEGGVKTTTKVVEESAVLDKGS